MDIKEIGGKYLYKFLVKNRVLDKYLYNLLHQNDDDWRIRDYKEDGNIVRLLSRFGLISSSFTWAKTPQGGDFWCKLNEKELGEVRKIREDIETMNGIYIHPTRYKYF